MLWHCESERLTSLVKDLPGASSTAIALAELADRDTALRGSERTMLSAMRGERRRTFSSGRYCVRAAQHCLGLSDDAIGRAGRVPIWPAGTVGSISHCSDLAVAGLSCSLAGMGVDIERSERITPKLHGKIFTERERADLEGLPSAAAAVTFSAKEAGYKAIFPLSNQYIGFQEAEIIHHWTEQSFTIRYLGSHAPNRRLEGGVGYWRQSHEHVMTLFLLD